ncbi:HPBP1-like protein [Mya arenaria]|uniref:HPBP1-like protein n=1 Tax=Mya arenaria TaxID=6604 RepID=A0ABY7E291_MYAAR|nr:HPBP1-like protein [Mya arenaria]
MASGDPNENSDQGGRRKEWLEQALNNMTVSPIEEIRKARDIVKDESRDIDDRIAAVETINEWCDQIDLAIDFHKIGGFDIFPVCLSNEEGELRWQCLDLVATMVQNNPYCQTATLEAGLLPTMLDLMDNDPDPTVKTKALYAMSCLTRDNQQALDAFIQHDGFSYVMRAMQSDVEKLKIKSAFMLSSICTDNDRCKNTLCDIGMIDQLVGHLSEEHSMFHEHVMSAILNLVRNHPRSLRECCRPELDLVSTLQQKQADLKGTEEFLEEYNYTVELLGLLQSASNTEAEATR